MRRHTLALLPALLVAGTCAAQTYTPADISQWPERRFTEPTHYQLEQRSDSSLLRADCSNGQASARYLEQQIDLRETPVLRWSWTISAPLQGLDERQRDGDDYPVRLYVVKDGGLLAWRTLALNYVWSSSQPVGSHWPNAYTANAQMLAVSSGAPAGMTTLERNVREDFQRLHGQTLDQIDGVAIMTDCDNSGQSVTGWYGTIEWLPATSSSTDR
ncbi:DUF3047 domain-containing protein [Halopseudomonas maritima]|uniref:DUF3047 domain-containing protein n=1 Tax=Halopseudomonas maritima TaxID=2918528 RepID=UPI001EECC663|nr:DUF3047 domain-containing protein [Halopseudomonas maritima]UJJ30174.1 DUF3047 domain-containing protein [Halopseudomonas maritima]